MSDKKEKNDRPKSKWLQNPFTTLREAKEKFVESHTPTEMDTMTIWEEFKLDIVSIYTVLVPFLIAVFVLSSYVFGKLYCWVTQKNKFLVIWYGATSMFWADLIVVFLAFYFFYSLYRASKARYSLSTEGDFYEPKRQTYGNAHFQTQEEMEENFNIHDSIEDTVEQIIGMTDDGRPISIKDDDTHRRPNYNSTEIGGSGSGKTAAIVKTFIYQALRAGHSIISTDTKGDLYKDTASVPLSLDYKVKALILKKEWFKNSDGFNPLVIVNSNQSVSQNTVNADIISTITLRSTDGDKTILDYWYKNAFNLLKCLILYVCTKETEVNAGHNNIPYIYTFLTTKSGQFDTLLGSTEERGADNPINQCYNLFKAAKPEVQGQIINDLGVRLQNFASGEITNILSHDDIDPLLPMKEKCIYYCILDDMDKTYRCIASLFFSICFLRQAEYSDGLSKEEKKTQLPVLYMLDEFANTGGIEGLPEKISTTRSRKMWLNLILQDIGQLNAMYGEENAGTILNNCAVKGCIGSTHPATCEYFSKLCGTQTRVSRATSNDESTADVVNWKTRTRASYTEHAVPLMNPEDFGNGTLTSDEVLYCIQYQQPVKLKKYFSEKNGESIHPLEKEAVRLGERKCSERIPQWRREAEELLEESESIMEDLQSVYDEEDDFETEEESKELSTKPLDGSSAGFVPQSLNSAEEGDFKVVLSKDGKIGIFDTLIPEDTEVLATGRTEEEATRNALPIITARHDEIKAMAEGSIEIQKKDEQKDSRKTKNPEPQKKKQNTSASKKDVNVTARKIPTTPTTPPKKNNNDDLWI